MERIILQGERRRISHDGFASSFAVGGYRQVREHFSGHGEIALDELTIPDVLWELTIWRAVEDAPLA